jgi:hypothetical protein
VTKWEELIKTNWQHPRAIRIKNGNIKKSKERLSPEMPTTKNASSLSMSNNLPVSSKRNINKYLDIDRMMLLPCEVITDVIGF